MSKHKASLTAKITTLARATLTEANCLFEDKYAKLLLTGPWRFLKQLLKTNFRNFPWFRELLANVGGRSCFYDEQLKALIDSGISQVVILGAGYDSRAMRFHRPGVSFFEVDMPSTQARKRSWIAHHHFPQQPVFIPADLTQDDLKENLVLSGFDVKKPCFVLMEGVLEYLDQESAIRVFSQLSELSAEGSVFLFDPLEKHAHTNLNLFRKLTYTMLKRMGEPRLFAITPEQIPQFLEKTGWQYDQHLTVYDLYDRYLQEVIRRPRVVHNFVVKAVKSAPKKPICSA